MSDESWEDLSKYAVEPNQIRKLVRKFRNMNKRLQEDGGNSSIEEDAKKAFALFELRSRVMETDIQRGLEQTGGTVIVDDIILTPYNQAAHRIRDAIIVSKAWRDGASPKDARTASLSIDPNAVHCIRRGDDGGGAHVSGGGCQCAITIPIAAITIILSWKKMT